MHFIRIFQSVTMAFALLASCVVANAADPSAQQFLAAIYQSYVGKDANGVPLDTPQLKTLLTPGLLKLIDADAKRSAKRNEPPELNGDPFVDAQDWDITGFNIQVTDTGPAKATAKVSLTGVPKGPIELDLVKTKEGWRIDDFRGPSGSVRKLLAKAR
jgi:hypothetical protein